MTHFELIDTLERLSKFYGSLIFVQFGNHFFGILVYTFLIIREIIFKKKEIEQIPSLGGLWYGYLDDTPDPEIEEEFTDPLKLANEIFGYFYRIFRIIVLIFLVEILSNRKVSTLVILKR